MIRVPACLLVCVVAMTTAVIEAGAVSSDEDVSAQIAARFPGVSADDVRPSPIPGLYEVVMGPIVLYASADGRYVVKGDIYDLENDANLTEQRVGEARARTLEQLPEEELIIFGDDTAKYTVTVFTDVTCGYCRRMHSEIDEYLDLGIRVRYAAFPRNGMGTDTWKDMEAVWCAPDRRAALTAAKLDRDFETKPCETDSVMQQWQLGRLLGVRGTPALFTEWGEMIPGYVPPAQLQKYLEAQSRR